MGVRLYQPGTLDIGVMRLEENAGHHLARVLRAEVGDQIALFNGVGGEALAVIKSISKKHVDVEVLKPIERNVESPVKMILAQGIARGEKMDFIIQKAVELGISEIFPITSERCNVRLDREREQKRLLHWQAVVISACEQSGRNYLPIVHPPMALHDWLTDCQAERKYILSPHVTEKLSDVTKKPASVAILVGPEGGFSDSEMADAAKQHFTALNLGPRVLRTETAALAALAVLQFQFGDFA